ncbi:ROK family transcriptional regulator [Catellatospora tritici]|uniref:ROK family transcriptional regulator n=1 Tax=Catellatospora tritici TaxID=2851566 RepID=UPI001C2DADE2|nr:ROK family transcriptional regulator [Catellatospora tritici]MBV1848988.1 ROK family transcriptional regulator [Catellatospora tritici]
MQRGPQPADFADVRATNLAVVLRYVRGNAPCSRAEIAAATGLNKATVSSLVADLIDRRLLRETGLTEHRIGRPATMLMLDGSPYAAIGIEVNADYLTAVAVDLAGTQVLSWRRSFAGLAASPAQAATAIAALGRRAVNRVVKDGRRVLGLTVGVPGLVDPNGVVTLAPNLGWRDVNLRGALTRALGDPDFPVGVDNDANLAVLAESRYGAHAGTRNLVYLTGEVGIGAGIIVDGRLLRGHRGFPGEIGHITIDPSGPRCRCGRRGCLEAVAGIAAIVSRVIPEATSDGELTDLQPEIDEVVRRARAADPAALHALTEVGHGLGQGVSILADLLDPEVIVLGGYFVPLSPWLLPAVDAELASRRIAPDLGGPQVSASILDHGAAATGGAATVLDHVDEGHLPTP